MADYRAGQVIDDRYEIVEKIGKGGHGVVYRALDRDLASPVAIKFLHPDVAAEPGFKTRMQREARSMGQLAGTSAVQVLAFNRGTTGEMYLVMEFLEGKDLGGYLDEVEEAGGTLPVEEMIAILDPIVETLEAAHARGIIHRDLKLANIFVLDNATRGRVRLLDFGLAKDMKVDPLTLQGMVAGSPSYMAPEVWRGKPELIDHRIDVYSLGIVIYRILSGHMPFDPRQSIDKLLIEVTRAPRPSLLEARMDLPPTIDDWVQKALAISPNDRFNSVQAEWNVLKVILR